MTDMTRPLNVPRLSSARRFDREGARRSDEAFVEGLRTAPAARFMVLADLKPVIESDEARTKSAIRWLKRGELTELGLPPGEAYLLGTDRATGAGHFALPVSEHRTRHAPGALMLLRPIVDLRTLAIGGTMSSEDLSLIGLARALAAWHQTHRHCGNCGGTNMIKDGGWKRKCWACGHESFPRTDPVVIMLVSDGERCLLGHEGRFDPKMWSTLAGFMEPGEDIADAVRRETLEEAGIEVGDVSLIGNQPWPFPHSLMLGCHAKATSREIKVNVSEIKDARWFSRDELRQMLAKKHPDGLFVPGQWSIAWALIDAWARD